MAKKTKTTIKAQSATRMLSAKQMRLATLIILACSILIWFIVKLQNPTTLPVKLVEVEGQYHHIKPKQLKQLLMPYVSKGFFNVSVRAIKRQLLTLPWVDKVAVSQVWPHKIVIHFTEQQPLALWNDSSVINTRGELFTPKSDNMPTHLPRLRGNLVQEPAIVYAYQRMSRKLKSLGVHISTLSVSPNHSYTLMLDNGMEIMLGQQRIWQRLHRFVKVYPRLFMAKHRHAQIIDMRYNNGIAVKWS